MFEAVGQVLAGWLLADFLSGLFHWWQDRIADVNDPIIGRVVILGAREHHLDPLDFLGATVFRRNLPIWLACAVISGCWLTAFGPSVFWVTTTVVASMSGEIHVLAHRPQRGGSFVRWLRATGLIQSPAQHARHHHRESDVCYCVITNWLNPVLDDLRFWAMLAKIAVR